MTDPISDMFNRIRNAKALLKPRVEVPFSNLKYEIAKILEKEGYIEKAEKKGKKTKKTIEISLKYLDKQCVISELKRVSRPGQRVYLPRKAIRRVRGGYGISIISTSRGLMTDKEARKQKIGGEIICQIW
jgi:small subunit ribosomal protein S8